MISESQVKGIEDIIQQIESNVYKLDELKERGIVGDLIFRFQHSEQFWTYLFFFWIFCFVFAYKDSSVCMTEDYSPIIFTFQTFLIVQASSSLSLLSFSILVFILRKKLTQQYNTCIKKFMKFCQYSFKLIFAFKIGWFCVFLGYVFSFFNFENCSNILIQFIAVYFYSFISVCFIGLYQYMVAKNQQKKNRQKKQQTKQENKQNRKNTSSEAKIQINQKGSAQQINKQQQKRLKNFDSQFPLFGKTTQSYEHLKLIDFFTQIYLKNRMRNSLLVVFFFPIGGMILAFRDTSPVLSGNIKIWLIVDFGLYALLSIFINICVLCFKVSYGKCMYLMLILKTCSILTGIVFLFLSNFADYHDILLQFMLFYFLYYGHFILEIFLLYFGVKQLKQG